MTYSHASLRMFRDKNAGRLPNEKKLVMWRDTLPSET
jgi:hypothetical protein